MATCCATRSTASKVALDYVKFSDLPTTLAFVRLVDGQATYLFYDENTAGRMLYEADLPAIGPDIEAMHFSCISLIPEPCGSTYEALMRREQKSRVMMFDPNIRKNFIKDKPAHLARMKRMLAMADIVKLSDEDLDWFGETGSTADIAARWLEQGPKLMVVTKGADGLVAFSKDHSVSVPAEKVTVVDTVGAGDTINAGILALAARPGAADQGCHCRTHRRANPPGAFFQRQMRGHHRLARGGQSAMAQGTGSPRFHASFHQFMFRRTGCRGR